MFLRELQEMDNRPTEKSFGAKLAMETPVSMLNILATHREMNPIYTLIAKEGRVHAPVFTYQVELMDMVEEGSGQSKKKAKHIAARNMLKRMIQKTELIEDKEPVRELLRKCDEEDIAEAKEFDKKLKQEKLIEEAEGVAAAASSAPLEADSAGGGGGDVPPEAILKPISAQIETQESNPIGKLQEICMKKHWNSPRYEDIGENGQPHERMFEVMCIIDNMDLVQNGSGKSKKLAKRNAAQEMLIRLRRENMDKVDELLDRIPRGSNLNSQFDLGREIAAYRKNRDTIIPEDMLRAEFYRNLVNDEAKMSKLAALFKDDLEKFIIDYMSDNKIIEDVEEVTAQIESIIQCKVDISPSNEKRHDGMFQYLAEYIALEPKYRSVSLLCTYGVDDNFEYAKEKTLTKCIVALLCNLVPPP